MKRILSHIIIRLVSAILFVAKHSGMIESYRIDKAVEPGIFNRFRVEWEGEEGNEQVCIIEALDDYIIFIDTNGAKAYYESLPSWEERQEELLKKYQIDKDSIGVNLEPSPSAL